MQDNMNNNKNIINGFVQVENNRFKIKKQQIAYAILGFLFIVIFIIANFILYLDLENPPWFTAIGLVFLLLFGVSFGLFFIAAGLYRVETEINLNTRKASITRKNFRGQKSTLEFNLDDIGITAIHFGSAGGASGTTTRPRWVVKAGFMTDDYDIAIYSKEISNDEEERDKVMLDLYKFFFPEDNKISKTDVKADSNKAAIIKQDKT